MQPELVVFDMAGTTVHDEDSVARCLQQALAAVDLEVGLAAVNAVMGLPKPEALHRLADGAGRRDLLPRVDELHEDFRARMIAFYRTDASVYEIPGASATFERLREAGVRVALDTGFDRQIADVVLGRMDWEAKGLVDAHVTSDEVAHGRPHPDMIRALMQRLGVEDPARVAKVGDTPVDLDEGTNAGCGWVIGVTEGSHNREELVGSPHTHLIANVSELAPVFGL